MLVYCCYKHLGEAQYETLKFLKRNISYASSIAFSMAFCILNFSLIAELKSRKILDIAESKKELDIFYRTCLIAQGLALFCCNRLANWCLDLGSVSCFLSFLLLSTLMLHINFESYYSVSIIEVFQALQSEQSIINILFYAATFLFLFSCVVIVKQVSKIELENLTVSFS